VTSGSTPFVLAKKIDAICFSGGVANLIYKSEANLNRYGDLGVYLGKAIRESRLLSAFRTIEPAETIRATVVGAGTYTTALSGSTIYFSGNIFPRRNLPVLQLTEEEQRRCFEGDEVLLKQKLEWFIAQSDEACPVLSMAGKNNPGYTELKTLAGCIAAACDEVLGQGLPILVSVESDIAMALGQLTAMALGGRRELCCIDSVHMEQGDYLDFGAPLMDGLVIPVVVKTLIFG
ncbi:MAG: ethanolamine ammonia-lyase reactivating factor EutA, partial [Angelakisella sp.]